MSWLQRNRILGLSVAILVVFTGSQAAGLATVRTPRSPAKPFASERPTERPQRAPEATQVPQTPQPTQEPQRAPTGSVQQRIAAAWPGNDAAVLKVVSCETGGTFNPNIKSKSGKYWGLFQADPAFRKTYGYGPSVEQQTAMAWRAFQVRGWRPWTCARIRGVR